jgi:hypothetical protein
LPVDGVHELAIDEVLQRLRRSGRRHRSSPLATRQFPPRPALASARVRSDMV